MPDTGDNLSDYWTPEQRLLWRQNYTAPFAGVSLAFCIVAQIIFFKFPRLRIFPRSLLSWLNYFNMYYCIYVIIKWVPVTPWYDAFAAHIKPGSPACRLAIFIDYSTLAGEFSCNTLLCFTVFLAVVCKVDIERYKSKFFWSYFAFVIIYPFGMAAVASTGWSTGWHLGDSCAVANETANLATRLPYLFFLSAQVIFLGSSLVYIKRIMVSVQTSDNNFPLAYLFVRFAATFLAQLYNVLPAQISLMFPQATDSSAIFNRFVYTSHSTGPIPDAIVMIVGNVDFMNWVKQYVAKLRIKWRKGAGEVTTGETTSTDPSPIRKEEGYIDSVAIPMEELHLAVSAERMGTSAPLSGDAPSKISLEDESEDCDITAENLL